MKYDAENIIFIKTTAFLTEPFFGNSWQLGFVSSEIAHLR